MIKPKTRKEKLLSAIANDTPVTIQPKNREELFLAQIAEKTGNVPKPLTRDYLPKGYPWDGRTVIEWDGNTEGKTPVMFADIEMYHVSDIVPTQKELLESGTIIIEEIAWPVVELRDSIETMTSTSFLIPYDFFVVVIGADGVGVDFGGTVFDKKGVYFSPIGEHTCSLAYGTTTPISETLLPESVKRVVVNFNMDDPENVTADKTYAELAKLLEAGVDVSALAVMDTNYMYAPLSGWLKDDATGTITFTTVTAASDAVMVGSFIIGAAGDVNALLQYVAPMT